MASNKRPPLELDELIDNLKQSSGKGVGAFFSSNPILVKPDTTKRVPSPTPSEEKNREKPRREAKLRRGDVTTSSRHNINLRKWRDIIEETETHNSALRITNAERYDIEDLVSELRRKHKITTSMNELARLGLLYIVNDFKKDKENSLIIKVKKS